MDSLPTNLLILFGGGLFFLATSVVGVRLLFLWHRDGNLPELLLGLAFLVGGTIGVLAGIAFGSVAESLLFGMVGRDPLVIVLVVLLLSGVALSAGYIPALRASRIHPMTALRYE